MRVTLATLLIIAFITPAFGQDARSILAESVSSNEKIVKGAPFSAEAIIESVQTLADGNKITRRTVSRLYRDSEGRFRREEMPKQLGVPGAVVEMPQSIAITDPVAGVKYALNPKNQTFRQSAFSRAVDWEKKMEEKFKSEEARIEAAETKWKQEVAKQAEEDKKQEISSNSQTPEAAREREQDKIQRQKENENREKQLDERKKQFAERKAESKAAIKEGKDPDTKPPTDSDPNSKTESLGVQSIEGIQAVGTRTTTIIPAGKIGNELPIEVAYERWYSPELQLIILSKNSDPRLGVQTYRLTNIDRSEQPITLFSPPPDYKSAGQRPLKPAAPPIQKVPPSPAQKPAPAIKKTVPFGPMELKKT